MNDLDKYFNGSEIYGDNFKPEEIEDWFRDEEEGYADLGAKNVTDYQYGYHALNRICGFDRLENIKFKQLFGFGAAYGDELKPVIDGADHVTIMDPSSAFSRAEVCGVPATYVKPQPNGALPFDSNKFDLITCFGVLHHIPNVSFVMKELGRVTQLNGCILLREPIVSMGDWRRPRRGLTKRERGIPLHLLEELMARNGLEIVSRSLCMFPLTPRVFKFGGTPVYNRRIAVFFDVFLCWLFAWNLNYHPRRLLDRFRPTSVFFVLRKIGASR